MNKIPQNIIFIIVFIVTVNISWSQFKVDTTGKVANFRGRIKVNKNMILESYGKIENKGQIFVNGGNATIKQDTIGGYVEFFKHDSIKTQSQTIPLITYDSVSIKGGAKVFDNTNKNLVSQSYFNSNATDIKWNKTETIEIHTNGYTKLDGTVNEGSNHGKIKMNGKNLQPVTGTGRYKVLELDNSAGAEVVEGGGFRVGSKLILTKGRLKNDEDNNFIMASNSVLERTAFGKIDLGPYWESTGNVTYKESKNESGNFVAYKDFKTGGVASGELYHSEPGEKNSRVVTIDTLIVEHGGGVKLDENLTVNHKIKLDGGDLYNYEENGDFFTVSNEKELTYLGDADPEFTNNEEIRGKFTRTNISANGRNYGFNNKHTFIRFDNDNDRNGIAQLTLDIKKQIRYASTPFLGESKIVRTMAVTAKDADGDEVADNFNLNYGFAWRNKRFGSEGTDGEAPMVLDELPPTDFRLLIWSEQDQVWDNVSTNNQRIAGINGDALNWTLADAIVNRNGLYSIGTEQNRLDFMRFAAKVALEGAFKLDLANEIIMKTDLRDSSRIPSTPPAIYPYVLDPNRSFIVNTQLPSNIVDWVVIEFRDDDFTPNNRYFKTCLLKNDGSLVDIDGFSPVTLSRNTTQNMDTTGKTPYYIAIRHRNHLTIMTENAVALSQVETGLFYDFTKSDFIMGGNNSFKPMGRDEDGELIFAMFGGNFVNPNVTRSEVLNGILGIDEITPEDYEQAWTDADLEGYFDSDFEMSGYVNSKDFNISWNNRTQKSVIK